MAWAYRVRQFARAVGAWFRPGQVDKLVVQVLPPRAAALFWAMPRYDRRHAVSVAHTLLARGHGQPELIAAALLHDAGKTAGRDGRLRLWHRVAVVLLQAAWPGLLLRLGQGRSPRSWRAPFGVQLRHAEIGARLAAEAGCSPCTIDLIRRHEDRSAAPDDPLLAALVAADNEN